MPEIHRGGCTCGYIRYRTLGAPERTTICHCTFCQRLTGSAFLVEPVFLIENVEVESGTQSTYEHRSPDHGRTLEVSFCPKCGTHLSLRFERFPTMQGMCGGTFDDPRWFKPDRHIFTGSAVPWMIFPADVDCYARHALKLDGSPEVAWQKAQPGGAR
jgi:hypothetical protein